GPRVLPRRCTIALAGAPQPNPIELIKSNLFKLFVLGDEICL
ncbi:Os08g0114125, partial [Oryza sativa Japonica Group]